MDRFNKIQNVINILDMMIDEANGVLNQFRQEMVGTPYFAFTNGHKAIEAAACHTLSTYWGSMLQTWLAEAKDNRIPPYKAQTGSALLAEFQRTLLLEIKKSAATGFADMNPIQAYMEQSRMQVMTQILDVL